MEVAANGATISRIVRQEPLDEGSLMQEEARSASMDRVRASPIELEPSSIGTGNVDPEHDFFQPSTTTIVKAKDLTTTEIFLVGEAPAVSIDPDAVDVPPEADQGSSDLMPNQEAAEVAAGDGDGDGETNLGNADAAITENAIERAEEQIEKAITGNEPHPALGHSMPEVKHPVKHLKGPPGPPGPPGPAGLPGQGPLEPAPVPAQRLGATAGAGTAAEAGKDENHYLEKDAKAEEQNNAEGVPEVQKKLPSGDFDETNLGAPVPSSAPSTVGTEPVVTVPLDASVADQRTMPGPQLGASVDHRHKHLANEKHPILGVATHRKPGEPVNGRFSGAHHGHTGHDVVLGHSGHDASTQGSSVTLGSSATRGSTAAGADDDLRVDSDDDLRDEAMLGAAHEDDDHLHKPGDKQAHVHHLHEGLAGKENEGHLHKPGHKQVHDHHLHEGTADRQNEGPADIDNDKDNDTPGAEHEEEADPKDISAGNLGAEYEGEADPSEINARIFHDGEVGEPGIQGPAGERGEPGSMGLAGEMGVRGGTGGVGPKGPRGPRGHRREANAPNKDWLWGVMAINIVFAGCIFFVSYVEFIYEKSPRKYIFGGECCHEKCGSCGDCFNHCCLGLSCGSCCTRRSKTVEYAGHEQAQTWQAQSWEQEQHAVY